MAIPTHMTRSKKPISNVSLMGRGSVLIVAVLMLMIHSGVVFSAHQGPPKSKWHSIEGDQEQKHEEVIATDSHEYGVRMAGNVDGVMTRMPISYGAYHQGWQPNRFTRLENIGDTDVISPWITVNGKRNWRTLKDIADEATAGCTSEQEKARAVWEFQRNHRFHATTWDRECDDAVKVYNIYGYTLCGNDARVISDLWKAAGLRTRGGYPVSHGVAEAFYDGEYHLLDGDQHAIYLRRDNITIASEAEIVWDHDLVKRTHNYGIERRDSRATDEFVASIYSYEGQRRGEHGGRSKHTMAYTLRPGESMEWRWDHIGKQYTAGTEAPDGKWRKDGEGTLAVFGEHAYDNMRNGIMRYAPDLESPVCRRAIESESNIAGVWEDRVRPAMHPSRLGRPAQVTWKIASAYVIVGGRVKARFRRKGVEDLLLVKLSRDARQWETLWTTRTTGDFHRELVFDDKLSPRGFPQYEYFLRVEMGSRTEKCDVGIESIEFVTDLQMSLLGLPELELGENLVRYADETKGPRRIRITHSWMERTGWGRPSAPRTTMPADGATVEGTLVKFRWLAPARSSSNQAEDYHFQLSSTSDMRWPLSPNFDKIISRTAWQGKAEWIVPSVGLLNPGTDYYWRVRAKNANGVWGAWSKVASFRCAGPGVPINVRAIADEDTGTVVLKWDANPRGRRPAMFRIYGSDEKGFSTSDTEYEVAMGRGFCKDMDEFNAKDDAKDDVPGLNAIVSSLNAMKTPSNFMTVTSKNSLSVVGAGLSLPNANKAFYRVVAVDENGNVSGASDYVDFSRPFIYSRLTEKVKVDTALTHRLGVVTSIGDLKCKPGYSGKAAFWDREYLSFSLVRAPQWLELDVQTGEISGTPGAKDVGEHEVVVQVTNNQGGIARRKFTVDVTDG